METVLYSFCQNAGQNCPDGANPLSGVTIDSSGNLYGTTANGGKGTYFGLIFKLTRTAGNGWSESTLYAFDGTNIFGPEAAPVFDGSGNLYGTAYYGGLTSDFCDKYSSYPRECGGVYKVSLKAGSWIEEDFLFNGRDGGNPVSGVVLRDNTLYGTTFEGGNGGGGSGWGVAFQISGETETALHKFCSVDECPDGASPYGTLVLHDNRLYASSLIHRANGAGPHF